MRHVRLSLVLVGALCALAVAAVPALAHEFTASKAAKTKGKAETEQFFKFGPFKFFCERVHAKGEQAAGASQTLAVAINFNHCYDEIQFGSSGKKVSWVPTRFKTPLALEYHANGFVETGSELEEFESSAKLAGGEAEIHIYTGVIPGANERSTCTLHWPEQTIPMKAVKKPAGEYSSVTYSNIEVPVPVSKNFPDGLRRGVLIANALKGIKYTLEGEPCEAWGKEETNAGGGATYSGSFPVLLNGGNLEFN